MWLDVGSWGKGTLTEYTCSKEVYFHIVAHDLN